MQYGTKVLQTFMVLQMFFGKTNLHRNPCYTDITSQPIESQTSIKITSMFTAFLVIPLRNLVNGYQMSNRPATHPLYPH